MRTRLQLTLVAALLLSPAPRWPSTTSCWATPNLTIGLTWPITDAPGPRAILIEARNLAYDANYRNDQTGLRSAIEILKPLATASEVRAYAHYYLSWAYWSLVGSQMQAKDMYGALASAKLTVEHARQGLTRRNEDPEFQTALVNALVAVAILDRQQFKELVTEIMQIRRRALELGPDNPRVVLMDAGWIFNTPQEIRDRREEGLARLQKALRLFEAEASVTTDPIAPRWGYASAYSALASWYLRMTPPQHENARKAAETALRMRPDFWYVREQVLPRLGE